MQAITDPPKDLLTPVGGRHSRSGENIQPRWAFILCGNLCCDHSGELQTQSWGVWKGARGKAPAGLPGWLTLLVLPQKLETCCRTPEQLLRIIVARRNQGGPDGRQWGNRCAMRNIPPHLWPLLIMGREEELVGGLSTWSECVVVGWARLAQFDFGWPAWRLSPTMIEG